MKHSAHSVPGHGCMLYVFLAIFLNFLPFFSKNWLKMTNFSQKNNKNVIFWSNFMFWHGFTSFHTQVPPILLGYQKILRTGHFLADGTSIHFPKFPAIGLSWILAYTISGSTSRMLPCKKALFSYNANTQILALWQYPLRTGHNF